MSKHGVRAAGLISAVLLGCGAEGTLPPAPPEELEAEARALARQGGCQSVTQCAAGPLGHKPCGGPRDHLVYCTVTTDVAALEAKLDQLFRLERERNLRSGAVSDCARVTPPPLELINGTCRAAPEGQPPVEE